MEKKYNEFLKKIGIDLSDLNHPISKEFCLMLKSKDKNIIRCYENLLKNMIIDILLIKQHSLTDYIYYINKLKKKDISFWGERFEICWYAALLHRIKTPIDNIRRGKAGIEADFVFELDNESFEIETTSLTFSQKSKKSDPIAKIISSINTKEKMQYATKNCMLVIDISNLMFYRKILNNFRSTIADISKEIDSKFGAIIFSEGYHIIDENNFQYGTRIYELFQEGIPSKLKNFITYNSIPIDKDSSSEKTIFFKNS